VTDIRLRRTQHLSSPAWFLLSGNGNSNKVALIQSFLFIILIKLCLFLSTVSSSVPDVLLFSVREYVSVKEAGGFLWESYFDRVDRVKVQTVYWCLKYFLVGSNCTQLCVSNFLHSTHLTEKVAWQSVIPDSLNFTF